MSEDLIERLREGCVLHPKRWSGDTHDDLGGSIDEAATDALMAEAAAALEAAREDACVALVADIRFACGDNGKRMQPELVEFIRGLAADAGRYRWLRDSKACSMSVSFNDHHNVYQSVQRTVECSEDYYDGMPEGELRRMIETDTIWTVHVYPRTPVSFDAFHGATLDAAIDQARGKGGGE